MKFLSLNIIFFSVFFTFVNPSFAGGPAWEAETTQYKTIGENHVVIELNAINPYEGWKLSQCKPLIVHIKYLGEPWWVFFQAKTWSKDVTKEKHDKAVAVLHNHWKSKKPITFGYIGTGLVPINEENNCEVSTRGVTVYEINGIVAFHDPV